MIEINNLTKIKISQRRIKNFLKKILKILKIKKDISLAFVNSSQIKKLNKIYLKRNKVTDVLSFSGEGELLGEIIISLHQLKKQAKIFHHSLEEEIRVILVHGLLHLIGFDHKKEKDRIKMSAWEKKLLNS